MFARSKKQNEISRRSFLIKGSVATAALMGGGLTASKGASLFLKQPGSRIAGVQIGAITYSYRSMPHNLAQLLQYLTRSGINAVELMGDAVEVYAGSPEAKTAIAAWRAEVSMEKFKEVKRLFDKAGIQIYAYKPNALNPDSTDAEIEYALKAAKVLGAKSVTVELPKDPAHSQRLGTLAAKHKVYVGYHAHTQATDNAWDTALAQSPYNSMNLDCGHYIAAGGNNTKETLLKLIENRHDRITSMHIKDRKTKENGGANLPWGQGDTPIKEILNLLRMTRYDIPATIELEYDIPAGSDAIQEVKKCFEFCKNALQPVS